MEKKDYRKTCEKAVRDVSSNRSEHGVYFGWHFVFRPTNPPCKSTVPGICIAIAWDQPQVETSIVKEFDGKLIIIPPDDDNGISEDGYLAIGCPIEVEGTSWLIKEGLYSAYYDPELNRFSAVAVDFEMK